MTAYITGGQFRDPDVGIVDVTVRLNSRHLTARWHGSMLKVSIPPHVTIAEFERMFAQIKPRVLARQNHRYHHGLTITTDFFSVLIDIQTDAENRIRVVRDKNSNHYTISVWHGLDLADPGVEKKISEIFKNLAGLFWEKSVRCMAVEEAEKIGKSPRFVKSFGNKRLGYCTADGKIALSVSLVYYPEELRRYVIRHELAHLTHFNHGHEFHALLDQYSEGQDARLHTLLKAFRSPII